MAQTISALARRIKRNRVIMQLVRPSVTAGREYHLRVAFHYSYTYLPIDEMNRLLSLKISAIAISVLSYEVGVL